MADADPQDKYMSATVKDGKPHVLIADDVDAEWIGATMGAIAGVAINRGMDPTKINQAMMQAMNDSISAVEQETDFEQQSAPGPAATSQSDGEE